MRIYICVKRNPSTVKTSIMWNNPIRYESVLSSFFGHHKHAKSLIADAKRCVYVSNNIAMIELHLLLILPLYFLVTAISSVVAKNMDCVALFVGLSLVSVAVIYYSRRRLLSQLADVGYDNIHTLLTLLAHAEIIESMTEKERQKAVRFRKIIRRQLKLISKYRARKTKN